VSDVDAYERLVQPEALRKLGEIMGKQVLWLAMFLFGLGGQVAVAANCANNIGIRAPLGKEAADAVGKALAAIKARNPKALLSMAGNRMVLFRRSVSNDGADRSGNVRLILRSSDIDSNLNIRIGGQVFPDFADNALFSSIDVANAIAVPRDICEDGGACENGLPPSVEIPFLMNDLLRCNRTGSGVFLLEDGLFVVDMKIEGKQMPLGAALFFSKIGNGYRFAGAMIQR